MTTFSNRLSRSGFTLVELLIVLSILIVLFSLTVGAVSRFRGMGYEMATTNVLKTVKTLLERQWKTVADKADREAIPATVQPTVNALAEVSDNLTAPRARVLYTKLRLKHAFPVSFAEVYTTYYTAPFAMREYQSYLTNLGITAANHTATTFTPEQQNAICLLMILERGPGGEGTTSNELANATVVLGTSPPPANKEIRGLVDGYRHPLILCRFPAGFAKLPAGQDPVDPENYLAAQSWRLSGLRPLAIAAVGHTLPASLRLQPVVASTGADGRLGLDLPTFLETDAALAADNKYTTDY